MRYMEEIFYNEGGDVLAWNKYVAMFFLVWEVVYRRMGLRFCVTFLSSGVCCGLHWCLAYPGHVVARSPEGGVEEKEHVSSFGSFTCLTNYFRKVKYCLFSHSSYSSSVRDPRLLKWERRNPSESYEILAWFFPSPGLGGLHHPPGH